MAAIEAHGAIVSIGTGTGSAKDITAVTLGAITEVTSVAHALAVGDVVTFAAITGTVELNGQTSMIIAKEDDALFFDIDSSAYTAYTSGGTATPVTWTEIGELIDWDGPGGSASVIDITHLQSTAREKMIGLMDEGQLTLTVNFLDADTGQLAVSAARLARLEKDWKLVYSDAAVQTFKGYALAFSSSGGVDDKVSGTITIEISGEVSLG